MTYIKSKPNKSILSKNQLDTNSPIFKPLVTGLVFDGIEDVLIPHNKCQDTLLYDFSELEEIKIGDKVFVLSSLKQNERKTQ